VTFKQLTITKRADKASPALMLAAAQGTNLGSVTLHVAKQGGEFLAFTFKVVAIKTVSWAHDDESPKETVTFEYGALAIQYQPPSTPGSTAAPVGSCYDAINQAVC